ncbi:patatin-like phospholipase family protein [Paenibacillus sp. SC116]|uniref:patatin-like phospholipase family protein n=1 Tax=Paenibacillus sp. SC116 TaxID=2968986 RepID=UPI00215A4D38|nr:patatin-like phospholipase family protein [Paenibacillus sp. SC116]MCR8843185.1 patatin-like phospholipase family protein [Paenibacillus sp. SC116]
MYINGVFEGGGVRGISLVGAVKAAERKGIKFRKVAGTSSGSIVASLIAAGYSADEMKRLIIDMPFSSFLKRSPIFNVKWIGPAMRLLVKKGLYSGEALERWMCSLLEAKGVRTFGDLEDNQLRIIASDITNGRLMVLPDDMVQYGVNPKRFSVSKAVRMSTSIPYFFDPVILRQSLSADRKKAFKQQFTYVVDGGMLSNFPLWLFDDDCHPETRRLIPTVGFQMVGKTPNQPHQINGVISMLQAIVDTMISAHDERYIEYHNRFRTVKIPTLGVGITEFNITLEKSLALFESGLLSGNEFFHEWDEKQYEQKLLHTKQLRK